MPVNHEKKFLKSLHTKALFPEPFSQKFEQLFPISETFFKKYFSEKSFQMVSTISGWMGLEI